MKYCHCLPTYEQDRTGACSILKHQAPLENADFPKTIKDCELYDYFIEGKLQSMEQCIKLVPKKLTK